MRRTASEVRAADGRIEALRALRWLVPTAVFERLRDSTPRYLSEEEFHRMLNSAGFRILVAQEHGHYVAEVALDCARSLGGGLVGVDALPPEERA